MINKDCQLEPLPAADFVEKKQARPRHERYPVYYAACLGGNQNSRDTANTRAKRHLHKLFDDYNDQRLDRNQRANKYHQERHLYIRKM